MNDVTQYHKLTGTIWQQWLAYGPVLVFATQFRLNEKAKALIRKGERVRGITEILHSYVKIISELIRIGEDVRHAKHYGTPSFMLVGDKKQSITSLHVNVEDLSPDDQIVAFWSEYPLMSSISCQTLSQRGHKALMHKSG